MAKRIKVKISNSKVECQGLYDPETNVLQIQKGSVIQQSCSPSYKYKNKRLEQISNFCDVDGETCTVKKKIDFVTPTAAANFCLGYEANGLLYWKNEKGVRLKDVLSSQKER